MVSVALGACASARRASPEDGRAEPPVRVVVLGEVEHPGWLTCSSRCDVHEAVVRVGGPTELARSVTVRRRQANGQWESEWFPLEDAARPRRATRLSPGDIVVIGSTL